MDHLWTVANQETNYDVSCLIAFKLLSRHVFCIKSTVTLTYDQLATKCVGVIY